MKALDPASLKMLGPALVGVSGGRDSVALLHLLVKAGAPGLVVAHLDHALREESEADARFVTELAARLGVECVASREDVAARAKSTRRSLETAARDARYSFFVKTASKHGFTRLILAHHADDQVETFLFNLLRGSGTRGLGAMRPLSTHRIGSTTLEVYRPLLGVWRSEVDLYVAEHALPFRDDVSNQDARHTRNRLRHEAIPLLNSVMRRDVRPAILRALETFSADDDFLQALLEPEDLAPQLFVAAVRELPIAVQRRVLHGWLRANHVRDVSFDHVEQVRGLLAGEVAKVNLANGQHARRRAGRLFLEGEPPTAAVGGARVSSPP